MQATAILPSINARTFEEVQELIKKVEPHVTWCHLDVTDGVFSKHPTWNDPSDLPRLDTKLKAEVHLMIAEPEKVIHSWLAYPIRRVIVHLEAVSDPEFIIRQCREAKIEIGFAISPGTSWEKFVPWFGTIDMLQILNVRPGASGQEAYWPETLGKIRHIREACDSCMIEVDGGVNPESAKKAMETGANLLVSGGYIFGSSDIAGAIKRFKEN